MSQRVTHDWLCANQQHLSAAITEARCALALHASRGDASAASSAERELEAARNRRDLLAQTSPSPTALEGLSVAFELSSFERDIVVLCAAMELEGTFAASCALGNGDPQTAYPTFGLALAAIEGSHWSALLPSAPLRHWHLVKIASSGGAPGAALTTRPLSIDERVLHFLTGLDHLDDRLAGIMQPISVEAELVPTHRALAAQIETLWEASKSPSDSPVIALHGTDSASAKAVAAAACASRGLSLHAMNAQALPLNPVDLHLMVRLWNREVRLRPPALLIECDSTSHDPQRDSALSEFVEYVRGPLVLVSRERHQVGRRSVAGFEISRPTVSEQRMVWSDALRQARWSPNGALDRLTSQFCFNTTEIQSASAEAHAIPDPDHAFERLWDACRTRSRGRLDDLAQRIESTATFNDLVLPDPEREVLEEVLTHVKHRSMVYQEWGFGAPGQRGLGISALFAGASGTGKTMAAEVLARALRLDLYRIDLSSVVSKYIGETEKNLRRIFDAADGGGVILLFDEADALFGKRSEVKDSHDRYANIEVSYLLQRMESYRGLAILTTNLKSALDPAFLRRIRFIVQFPFPNPPQRAEIWRRVFPPATPTEGLDVSKLAQLSVAGGSIRNMALKAAFLAADMNEPVGMFHVLRAARSEYAKLEKPLTDVEVAGWV
jgi:hypothetical protein